MKRELFYVLFFIPFFTIAQTKVGDIHFNDIDVFHGSELMLNGAGSKEKKYAIALYLDFEVDGVEDGIMVADKDVSMAVTIKIVDNITSEEFKTLIRNGLECATDGNSYLIENEIRDFFNLIPRKINKYDIFKIAYKKGEGVTIYNGIDALGTVKGLDFKKALFKIWLGDNPTDPQLKIDLLGSNQLNPVLGKWKTFDKDTGVGISVVQLYMIKDRVFGVIERMLRQSERDAVCYECKGDDHNQNVEGLVIIKGLKPKDDNKYINGRYTNIKNGEVLSCQVWFEDEEEDVLHVKIKGIGEVEWKRIKE